MRVQQQYMKRSAYIFDITTDSYSYELATLEETGGWYAIPRGLILRLDRAFELMTLPLSSSSGGIAGLMRAIG
jgi:hypothetical protein